MPRPAALQPRQPHGWRLPPAWGCCLCSNEAALAECETQVPVRRAPTAALCACGATLQGMHAPAPLRASQNALYLLSSRAVLISPPGRAPLLRRCPAQPEDYPCFTCCLSFLFLTFSRSLFHPPRLAAPVWRRRAAAPICSPALVPHFPANHPHTRQVLGTHAGPAVTPPWFSNQGREFTGQSTVWV